MLLMTGLSKVQEAVSNVEGDSIFAGRSGVEATQCQKR
jgi:hypothetical protein